MVFSETGVPPIASYREMATLPILVCIVNPKAGNGRCHKLWQQVSPLVAQRLDGKYQVKVQLTTLPRHAEELAATAVAQGASAVVAVGGDGTVSEVVNGLMKANDPTKHSCALAIFPLGTGCDYIRTFGWSESPEEAIRRLEIGTLRVVDVGHFAGRTAAGEELQRHFLNSCSCGLGVHVAESIPRFRWLGGKLGYKLASAWSFLKYKNTNCLVKVDQNPEWLKLAGMTIVVIANGKYVGGGLKIAPGADPCDGKFEVVTVVNQTLMKFAMLQSALQNGSHVNRAGFNVLSANSIVIQAADDNAAAVEPIRFELDGEPWGSIPSTIRVIPNALQLFG